MKFDKIYILAINHNQKKLDDIIKRLSKLNVDGVTTYEVLNGHNGWDQPTPENVNVYDKWGQLDSWNDFWKEDVQPGEVGCALSHMLAWNKIIEDGVSNALILEEDFVPELDLKNLEEPSKKWPYKWDYLNLGRYTFDRSDDIKINDTYCIPSLHYNMHAYVLTNIGAQKLLSYKLEKNIIPVDEFITAAYMQHRRPDIEEIYPIKLINALATNKSWVSQSSNAETTTVSAHTKTFQNPDRERLFRESAKETK